MNRPTIKELDNKIREAKAAIRNQNILLVNQDAIAEDALELEYDIAEELYEVLEELLNEICSDNYVGSRPPEKSYEDKIRNSDLFPFVIDSQRFQCEVYLKFTLGKNIFWLVSLHKNRPFKE